jgi:hypothetical protein
MRPVAEDVEMKTVREVQNTCRRPDWSVRMKA